MTNHALAPAVVTAVLMACLTALKPALASGDHERAREALRQGLILPLDKILSIAHVQQPGQILEVELEDDRHGGQKLWVYEIKGITSDGRLFKLKINAQTGEILEARSRDGRGTHTRAPNPRGQ